MLHFAVPDQRSAAERIQLPRLALRLLGVGDAPLLLRYVAENRAWLQPWEPCRQAGYFTLAGQRSVLAGYAESQRQGTGMVFGAFLRGRGAPRGLIGRVSLTQVLGGAIQSAVVGYSVGQAYGGQHYGMEMLRGILAYSFGTLGLHRLQASVMPENRPSIHMLKVCGFRAEGLALRYLQINGVWEDHQIYALTEEEAVLPQPSRKPAPAAAAARPRSVRLPRWRKH